MHPTLWVGMFPIASILWVSIESIPARFIRRYFAQVVSDQLLDPLGRAVP